MLLALPTQVRSLIARLKLSMLSSSPSPVARRRSGHGSGSESEENASPSPASTSSPLSTTLSAPMPLHVSCGEGGLLGASLPEVLPTPSADNLLLAARARTAAAKAAAEEASAGLVPSRRLVRFVEPLSEDCDGEAERDDAGDTASNSDTMSEGDDPNIGSAVKEAFSRLSGSTRALLG